MRTECKQLVSMPIFTTRNLAEVVACGMVVYEGKNCLRIDTIRPTTYIQLADGSIQAEANSSGNPDMLWIPADEKSQDAIWGVPASQKIKEIEDECTELGIPFSR